MRTASWLVAAACVVAVGCRHDTGGTTTVKAPNGTPLLADVPADTPYVIAGLEPLSDAYRARVGHQLEGMLAKAQGEPSDHARVDHEAWMRVVRAFYAEVHGKPSWADALGLAPTERFVIYGLSMWPVLRVEVADPARLRLVIQHLLGAAVEQLPEQSLGGHAFWAAPVDKMTIVGAVLEHEAVLALVPTSELPQMLPKILGTERPVRSLAEAGTLDAIRKAHDLGGAVIAYTDARELVAIAAGHGHGDNGALASPLVHVASLDGACGSELDQLLALAPRVIYGYHHYDNVQFATSMIIETSPLVAAALARLHTTVPGVTNHIIHGPLFTMGMAVDGDALFDLITQTIAGLHGKQFTCPDLRELDGDHLADITAAIANLPPYMHGLRGGALVVDDLHVKPETNATGYVLIVGAHMHDLVTNVLGRLPFMGSLAVAATGLPIPLPVAALGMPGVTSAHLVLTAERAAIAVGPDSAGKALAPAVAAPPAHSPLFTTSYDLVRLRTDLPDAVSDTPLAVANGVRDITMRIDVDASGIVLDFDGDLDPM